MGCAVNSRSFVDLFFKRCDWFVLVNLSIPGILILRFCLPAVASWKCF